MSNFKLIVAGSRGFSASNYDLLWVKIMNRYANKVVSKELEIVSGGCYGADVFGERFAEEFKLDIQRFLADFDKYGKAAGPIRNKQMAEYADAAIVFWDAESRGSLNMIQQMRKLGKKVTVIIYPR